MPKLNRPATPHDLRQRDRAGSTTFGPGERHISPQDDAPEWPNHTQGDSRGYDARTGKKLWDFHTVPRPGETGNDTWEGESWKDRGGTNVWSVAVPLGEEGGIVYMPDSLACWRTPSLFAAK